MYVAPGGIAGLIRLAAARLRRLAAASGKG